MFPYTPQKGYFVGYKEESQTIEYSASHFELVEKSPTPFIEYGHYYPYELPHKITFLWG